MQLGTPARTGSPSTTPPQTPPPCERLLWPRNPTTELCQTLTAAASASASDCTEKTDMNIRRPPIITHIQGSHIGAFGRLSGELRNQILRNCLVSEEPIRIQSEPCTCSRGHCSHTPRTSMPSIARTCTQLQTEAASIYFGENEFLFEEAVVRQRCAPNFLRGIGRFSSFIVRIRFQIVREKGIPSWTPISPEGELYVFVLCADGEKCFDSLSIFQPEEETSRICICPLVHESSAIGKDNRLSRGERLAAFFDSEIIERFVYNGKDKSDVTQNWRQHQIFPNLCSRCNWPCMLSSSEASL